MMELLKTFSALALICGLMSALLPEGSLRRTAAMSAGLLLLLIWSEGIETLLQLPDISPPPSVLTFSGADIDQFASAAADMIRETKP